MSRFTPILRLPSELRLRILIDVVSNGPEPASPSSPFCCLDEYCRDYLKHRYAIFKMPEFRDLKITYPNAFKQSTAVVLAWTRHEQACAQEKARQEGQPCASGYIFICFGLLQRHPAPLGPSAAQATIPQIVHGRSWSHHLTLPITDLNTVRLVTDDRSPRATRALLTQFFRSLRLTAAQLHFVNLVRSEHSHVLLSRDSDKIQQACKDFAAILSTVDTSGVAKLELEVVDQVHEIGRSVVVGFERADSGNGRRWIYDALEEIEPDKYLASAEHADTVARRSKLLVDPRLCKLNGEDTWHIVTPGWQVAVAILTWLVLLLALYKAFILFRPSRPTGDSVHAAILEKERQITFMAPQENHWTTASSISHTDSDHPACPVMMELPPFDTFEFHDYHEECLKDSWTLRQFLSQHQVDARKALAPEHHSRFEYEISREVLKVLAGESTSRSYEWNKGGEAGAHSAELRDCEVWKFVESEGSTHPYEWFVGCEKWQESDEHLQWSGAWESIQEHSRADATRRKLGTDDDEKTTVAWYSSMQSIRRGDMQFDFNPQMSCR